MEHLLKEYALYLNDTGFDLKPLEIDEDYSHVLPSSGYKPILKIKTQDSAEDADDQDGSGERNDQEDDDDDDDVMDMSDVHPEIPVTPSKKRPTGRRQLYRPISA